MLKGKVLSYQAQKTPKRKKKKAWELPWRVHTTQQILHIYLSLQKYRIFFSTSQDISHNR
jgi:hypothetical protein